MLGTPFSYGIPFPFRTGWTKPPTVGSAKKSRWPKPKGLLKVVNAECELLAPAAGTSAPASSESESRSVFRVVVLKIIIILIMGLITPKR